MGGRTLSCRMDHLVCQYGLKHEYVTAARGPARCHVVRPATLVWVYSGGPSVSVAHRTVLVLIQATRCLFNYSL